MTGRPSQLGRTNNADARRQGARTAGSSRIVAERPGGGRFAWRGSAVAASSGPRVSVMQSADLRDGDDSVLGQILDSAWHRSVAFQREMGAPRDWTASRPKAATTRPRIRGHPDAAVGASPIGEVQPVVGGGQGSRQRAQSGHTAGLGGTKTIPRRTLMSHAPGTSKPMRRA